MTLIIEPSSTDETRDWQTFDAQRPKGPGRPADADDADDADDDSTAHQKAHDTASATAHATASATTKAEDAAHDHAGGQFADQDAKVMSKARSDASKLPKGRVVTHRQKMTDEEYRAHRDHVEFELTAHGASDLIHSPVSTHNSEDRVGGKVGKYTPEREALHRQIIAQYEKWAQSVPRDRRAVITAGLGGAGKSTVLRKEAQSPYSVAGKLGIKYDTYDEKGNGVGDPNNFITLNPDEIKEHLATLGAVPKVDSLSPMEANPFTHEEASQLTERIANRLQAQGTNVIHDVTLNSVKSGDKRINALRNVASSPGKLRGYHVAGVMVDVSTHQSLVNAEQRHRGGQDRFNIKIGQGGRYVPSDLIKGAADPTGKYRSKNRAAFETLKSQGKFDQTITIDNENYAGKVLSETGQSADKAMQQGSLLTQQAKAVGGKVSGTGDAKGITLGTRAEADPSDTMSQILAYRKGQMALQDLVESLGTKTYATPERYQHSDDETPTDMHTSEEITRTDPDTWDEVVHANDTGLLTDAEYDAISARADDHSGTRAAGMLSKAEARYRPTDSVSVHCSNCTHVQEHGEAASTCNLVEGTVDGHHVCDHFYPHPEKPGVPVNIAPSDTRNWTEWDEQHDEYALWKGMQHHGTAKEQAAAHKWGLAGALAASLKNAGKGGSHYHYKPPKPLTKKQIAENTEARRPVTGGYLERNLHDEGTWGKADHGSRYGGIMFDHKGRLLLREPLNHFDGYHWTFSKGHPESGEHPAISAIRETEEETGLHPRITGHVPGGYGGSFTGSKNHYYLMEDTGAPHDPSIMNGETSRLAWANPAQADLMMQQGTNVMGVYRDRQVLRAAIAAYQASHPNAVFPALAPLPPPPKPKPFIFPKAVSGHVHGPPKVVKSSTKSGGVPHSTTTFNPTKSSKAQMLAEMDALMGKPGQKPPGARAVTIEVSDTRDWDTYDAQRPQGPGRNKGAVKEAKHLKKFMAKPYVKWNPHTRPHGQGHYAPGSKESKAWQEGYRGVTNKHGPMGNSHETSEEEHRDKAYKAAAKSFTEPLKAKDKAERSAIQAFHEGRAHAHRDYAMSIHTTAVGAMVGMRSPDELLTRNWTIWNETHPYIDKDGDKGTPWGEAWGKAWGEAGANAAKKAHLAKGLPIPATPTAAQTAHITVNKFKAEAKLVHQYKPGSTRAERFEKGYLQARLHALGIAMSQVEAHERSVAHAQVLAEKPTAVIREGVAAGYHAHSVNFKVQDELENVKLDVKPSVTTTPPVGHLGPLAAPPTQDELEKFNMLSPGQKFANGETVPATGTNGGQWYEAPNGDGYLLKGAQSDEHAMNEVAGALAYEQAGIPVQHVSLVKMNSGKLRALSHYIPGITPIKPQSVTHEDQMEARKGFGMDALMSHYDLTGMVINSGGKAVDVDGPNLFKDKSGKVIRLDLGGTGRFKAMGGVKPTWFENDWTSKPDDQNEYETMKVSDQGKLAYGEGKGPSYHHAMESALKTAAKFDLGEYQQAMLNAGIGNGFALDQIHVLGPRLTKLKSMGYGEGQIVQTPAEPVVEPSTTTSDATVSATPMADGQAAGLATGRNMLKEMSPSAVHAEADKLKGGNDYIKGIALGMHQAANAHDDLAPSAGGAVHQAEVKAGDLRVGDQFIMNAKHYTVETKGGQGVAAYDKSGNYVYPDLTKVTKLLPGHPDYVEPSQPSATLASTSEPPTPELAAALQLPGHGHTVPVATSIADIKTGDIISHPAVAPTDNPEKVTVVANTPAPSGNAHFLTTKAAPPTGKLEDHIVMNGAFLLKHPAATPELPEPVGTTWTNPDSPVTWTMTADGTITGAYGGTDGKMSATPKVPGDQYYAGTLKTLNSTETGWTKHGPGAAPRAQPGNPFFAPSPEHAAYNAAFAKVDDQLTNHNPGPSTNDANAGLYKAVADAEDQDMVKKADALGQANAHAAHGAHQPVVGTTQQPPATGAKAPPGTTWTKGDDTYTVKPDGSVVWTGPSGATASYPLNGTGTKSASGIEKWIISEGGWTQTPPRVTPSVTTPGYKVLSTPVSELVAGDVLPGSHSVISVEPWQDGHEHGTTVTIQGPQDLGQNQAQYKEQTKATMNPTATVEDALNTHTMMIDDWKLNTPSKQDAPEGTTWTDKENGHVYVKKNGAIVHQASGNPSQISEGILDKAWMLGFKTKEEGKASPKVAPSTTALPEPVGTTWTKKGDESPAVWKVMPNGDVAGTNLGSIGGTNSYAVGDASYENTIAALNEATDFWEKSGPGVPVAPIRVTTPVPLALYKDDPDYKEGYLEQNVGMVDYDPKNPNVSQSQMQESLEDFYNNGTSPSDDSKAKIAGRIAAVIDKKNGNSAFAPKTVTVVPSSTSSIEKTVAAKDLKPGDVFEWNGIPYTVGHVDATGSTAAVFTSSGSLIHTFGLAEEINVNSSAPTAAPEHPGAMPTPHLWDEMPAPGYVPPPTFDTPEETAAYEEGIKKVENLTFPADANKLANQNFEGAGHGGPSASTAKTLHYNLSIQEKGLENAATPAQKAKLQGLIDGMIALGAPHAGPGEKVAKDVKKGTDIGEGIKVVSDKLIQDTGAGGEKLKEVTMTSPEGTTTQKFNATFPVKAMAAEHQHLLQIDAWQKKMDAFVADAEAADEEDMKKESNYSPTPPMKEAGLEPDYLAAYKEGKDDASGMDAEELSTEIGLKYNAYMNAPQGSLEEAKAKGWQDGATETQEYEGNFVDDEPEEEDPSDQWNTNVPWMDPSSYQSYGHYDPSSAVTNSGNEGYYAGGFQMGMEEGPNSYDGIDDYIMQAENDYNTEPEGTHDEAVYQGMMHGAQQAQADEEEEESEDRITDMPPVTAGEQTEMEHEAAWNPGQVQHEYPYAQGYKKAKQDLAGYGADAESYYDEAHSKYLDDPVDGVNESFHKGQEDGAEQVKSEQAGNDVAYYTPGASSTVQPGAGNNPVGTVWWHKQIGSGAFWTKNPDGSITFTSSVGNTQPSVPTEAELDNDYGSTKVLGTGATTPDGASTEAIKTFYGADKEFANHWADSEHGAAYAAAYHKGKTDGIGMNASELEDAKTAAWTQYMASTLDESEAAGIGRWQALGQVEDDNHNDKASTVMGNFASAPGGASTTPIGQLKDRYKDHYHFDTYSAESSFGHGDAYVKGYDKGYKDGAGKTTSELMDLKNAPYHQYMENNGNDAEYAGKGEWDALKQRMKDIEDGKVTPPTVAQSTTSSVESIPVGTYWLSAPEGQSNKWVKTATGFELYYPSGNLGHTVNVGDDKYADVVKNVVGGEGGDWQMHAPEEAAAVEASTTAGAPVGTNWVNKHSGGIWTKNADGSLTLSNTDTSEDGKTVTGLDAASYEKAMDEGTASWTKLPPSTKGKKSFTKIMGKNVKVGDQLLIDSPDGKVKDAKHVIVTKAMDPTSKTILVKDDEDKEFAWSFGDGTLKTTKLAPHHPQYVGATPTSAGIVNTWIDSSDMTVPPQKFDELSNGDMVKSTGQVWHGTQATEMKDSIDTPSNPAWVKTTPGATSLTDGATTTTDEFSPNAPKPTVAKSNTGIPIAPPPAEFVKTFTDAVKLKNLGNVEPTPAKSQASEAELKNLDAYRVGHNNALKVSKNLSKPEVLDSAEAAKEHHEAAMSLSEQAAYLGMHHGFTQASANAADTSGTTTSSADLMKLSAYTDALALAEQAITQGETSRDFYAKAGQLRAMQGDDNKAAALAWEEAATALDAAEGVKPSFDIPENTPAMTPEQVQRMTDYVKNPTSSDHGGDLGEWAYNQGRAIGINGGNAAAKVGRTAADLAAAARTHEDQAKTTYGLMRRKHQGIARGLNRVALAMTNGDAKEDEDNWIKTNAQSDTPKPDVEYHGPQQPGVSHGYPHVEVEFTNEEKTAIGKFTAGSAYRFKHSGQTPINEALNRMLGGKPAGTGEGAKYAKILLHAVETKSTPSKQLIYRGTQGDEFASGQLQEIKDAIAAGETVDFSMPISSNTYGEEVWQQNIRYVIDAGAMTMDGGPWSGSSTGEMETMTGGLMQIYKITGAGTSSNPLRLYMRQVVHYSE